MSLWEVKVFSAATLTALTASIIVSIFSGFFIFDKTLESVHNERSGSNSQKNASAVIIRVKF